MKSNKLTAAMAAIGPSPCEKYSCAKRDTCSSLRVACSSFRHYVDFGVAVSPYMHIPHRDRHREGADLRPEIVTSRRMFTSAMGA